MEELEKDMTPKLIGETWLQKHKQEGQRYRYGLYECQYCGREWECLATAIKNGVTKSCGCQRGKGFKHGLESNIFYPIWNAMIYRCNNPKSTGYYKYGARGITVCEDWLNPKHFIDWAQASHPNIEGVTLDRIDNDKGYSPDNCRWADKTTQVINQRMKKNNTSGYVGVSYHKGTGRWTASVGVNYKTLYIGTFLTIEEAVQARDNYITQNNLPHKLSTDYV